MLWHQRFDSSRQAALQSQSKTFEVNIYVQRGGYIVQDCGTGSLSQPDPFDMTSALTAIDLVSLVRLGKPFPYPERPISEISRTTAFNTGIDLRDKKRCIICGVRRPLEHAHIVPKVEDEVVRSLKIPFFC